MWKVHTKILGRVFDNTWLTKLISYYIIVSYLIYSGYKTILSIIFTNIPSAQLDCLPTCWEIFCYHVALKITNQFPHLSLSYIHMYVHPLWVECLLNYKHVFVCAIPFRPAKSQNFEDCYLKSLWYFVENSFIIN